MLHIKLSYINIFPSLMEEKINNSWLAEFMSKVFWIVICETWCKVLLLCVHSQQKYNRWTHFKVFFAFS